MDTTLTVAFGGACTAIGAVGSALINAMTARRTQVADAQVAEDLSVTNEATQLREELWAELRAVRTELRAVQTELANWKDRYYLLVADHAQVKTEYANFKADVTFKLASLQHDPASPAPTTTTTTVTTSHPL